MPTFTIGEKSPLPQLSKDFESVNIKNLFVIGSLSGIPLIKNAIDQGQKVIQTIRKRNLTSTATYDVIIVGGGPAGVTAAIEAQKVGMKYLLIEKGRLFELVHQYPKAKPIYAEPEQMKVKGDLMFSDKPKEELLKDWQKQVVKYKLNTTQNCSVSNIIKKKDLLEVQTCKGTFSAGSVILAIGDLGNPRKLNVPGEDLDHVLHKLDNPEKYAQKNVLVVGGGNSAVEAAISLAAKSNVTLSYRKNSFFRCSKKNRDKIEELVKKDKVKLELESNVMKIDKKGVTLQYNDGKSKTIRVDTVLVLVGFEPSLEFMQKINIKLAKTYELKDVFGMLVVGFIFFWVYAYNKGVSAITSKFNSVSSLFNLASTQNPYTLWTIVLWLTLIVGVGYIQYAGYKSIKKIKTKTHTVLISLLMFAWLVSAIIWSISFFKTGILFATGGAYWPYYTLLYSLVVTVFGLASILKYKKRYIWNRTLSLMYSQTFLLFLLPIFLFKDWRIFYLVYVWPLGPDALTNNYIPSESILGFISNTWFMWGGIFLSFVGFTLLVYYKGRGAVCSWFCGCGALAETLGDPFRTKTPQGQKAKLVEYASYILLGFAAGVTSFIGYGNGQLAVAIAVSLFTLFFMLFTWFKIKNRLMSYSILAGVAIGIVVILLTKGSSLTWYKYIADFTLAGWVALMAYFFIGGRIWCRYFCPLIAYLGVISSIGRFKIRPDPDKCISCGLCTRNCHMGIDVMNYAQKGHDMKEPSCVGCGICVEVCPMDLFNVVYDTKTIGPGTSYQIKANPGKFTILSMGGKPTATVSMLKARAELVEKLEAKGVKVSGLHE